MTEEQLTAHLSTPFSPETLAKLSPRDLKVLIWRQKWLNTAREKQLPPDHIEWLEWILCSGRGFGKTLSGAQWMGFEALIDPERLPSCVIAPTLNDVRYTCFEGHAGLITLLPQDVVADYNKTNLIVTLDNGAIIRGFSAEEPERLRGPQHARGWLEEVGAWGPNDEETFDMFMMGLRLGPRPRFVCTTTPKPRELIRSLVSEKKGRIVVGGSTYENRDNLPSTFFDQLAKYEGTQLGRQEIEGEIIDAEEGGVIQRSWLRVWPHDKPLPAFEYVVMSLDTALTQKTIERKTHQADPTACQVWGLFWHEEDGVSTTNILLLDAWQDHLGLPNLVKRVKSEMKVAYGDDVDRPKLKPLIGPARLEGSGRKPDIILIEEKGSGISLRQSLEADGIFTYAYNPGRADKLARLHLASDVFARRQVWVVESEAKARKGKPKSWADPVITQLCSFKGEGSIKHDDHVDAASQVVIFLKTKNLLIAKPRTPQQREKEALEAERPARRRSYVNPYAV